MPVKLGTKRTSETLPIMDIGNGFSGMTETQHTSLYNEFGQLIQDTSQNPMEPDNNPKLDDLYVRGNDMTGFNMYTSYMQESEAYLEDIALPDAFLEDYYSQVMLVLLVLQCLPIQ